MKSKNKRSIYALAGFAMMVAITISCDNKNDDPELVVPVLTTYDVTDITQRAAIGIANVSSEFGNAPTERGICWSTSPLPNLDDNHIQGGTGFGEFNCTMELLTPGTIYYIRSYAINDAGTGYGNEIEFTTQPSSSVTASDIDGNVYHIVTIGTQDWMVENLQVTRYRNGDPIPNITEKNAWIITSDGAYCTYENGEFMGQIYGNHYNWAAVNDPRNIAPEGFHVPSYDEWMTLVDYLGGQFDAGGKLKETGIAHWSNVNVGATNETGFSALPAGFRDADGNFGNINGYGYFWTSTEDSDPLAWFFGLNSASTTVVYSYINKENGYSIRCIRD